MAIGSITGVSVNGLWIISTVGSVGLFLGHTVIFVQQDLGLAAGGLVGGEGSILWSDFWKINFSFVSDSLNVPFLWNTTLIFLIVLLVGRHRLVTNVRRLVALQLLEAGVLGMYAAGNLFVFGFFAALSILPATFLVGLDGDESLRQLAKRYAVISAVGVFLLLFTFMSLQSSYRDNLVSWFGSNSANGFPGAFDFLFVIMAIVMLFKVLIFPFHSYFSGIVKAKNLLVLLPVLTVGNYGIYAIFRFLIPLFSNEYLIYARGFLAIGMLSVFWSLFGLLQRMHLRKKVLLLSQLLNGIAFIGLGCGNKEGFTGVLLCVFFNNLILAMLLMTLEIGERLTRQVFLDTLREFPGFAALFGFTVLSMFCFPVSLGFHGAVFVFWGLSEIIGIHVLWLIVMSVLFLLVGCYRTLFIGSADELRGVKKAANWEFSVRELCCWVPVSIFLVVLGIFPEVISAMVLDAVTNVLANLEVG